MKKKIFLLTLLISLSSLLVGCKEVTECKLTDIKLKVDKLDCTPERNYTTLMPCGKSFMTIHHHNPAEYNIHVSYKDLNRVFDSEYLFNEIKYKNLTEIDGKLKHYTYSDGTTSEDITLP